MNYINIVTAQNVTLRIELANIGDRFLAAILDFIIKIGLLIGIAALSDLFKSSGIKMPWVWVVIVIVVFMFYSLAFEIFMKGQTPGKRVMKIRVARLDGEQVTVGNLLLRWLFRIIDFPFNSFPTIGILTIVASEKNQRLGDMVAGTVLVSSKERTKLENTFYKELEAGYVTVFSQAEQLSAREVEIIQEVLGLYDNSDKYDMVPALAERIKALLQVEPPMDDLTFLRTILKDYNHSGSEAIAAVKAATNHTTFMPPAAPVDIRPLDTV